MMKVVLGCLLISQAVFGQWVPTWTAAPQAPRAASAFHNQTVRMVVRTSIAGRRVRVVLSNAYGNAPLIVGSVHIGLRAKDSAVVAGSDKVVNFDGKPNCSIPMGAFLISDTVALEVAKQTDLAISVFVPGETGPATTHSVGLHTTYIKTGDTTGAAEMADGTTTASYYWLAGVEVEGNAPALVALGDSITDGTRSTNNANASWPSFLAQRLPNIAVLNEAISANRVLRDGVGQSALGRFDRDVIAQPDVKWVVLLEGINDIGAGLGPEPVFNARPKGENVTAEELIGAYKQLIERAHAHGIRIYASPLTPFEGAAYYNEERNEIRQKVNQWIRTAKAFDGVIDFEAAIQDPAHPNKMRADLDSGDHLHPNDAGYKAMADAVKLALFQ